MPQALHFTVRKMKTIYYKLLSIVALSTALLTSADIISKFSFQGPAPSEALDISIQDVPENKQKNRDRLTDFSVITKRNIFGATETDSCKQEAFNIEQLDPTSLDIALLGTVTDDMQDASYAVIREAGKTRQGLFRVGDSIQNAIVGKVLRGKVVLEVGDKAEVLYMEKTVSASSSHKDPGTNTIIRDTHVKVDIKNLKNATAGVPRQFSQVAVRPHFSNGRANGMVITRIRAGSVFSRLGLKNGDILHEVNGRPIKARDQILSLYKNLESGSRISLEIERKGKRKQISYQFR